MLLTLPKAKALETAALCVMANMVVSHNKGTIYRHQNTLLPIMGTTKKVALVLGNSHIGDPAYHRATGPPPLWLNSEDQRQLHSS